ncbi:Clp protease ClpP, partial [Bacillus cereus]|nr:Clp protease ClpP [Bacillus cereus]MEB8698940.1 Clp protease ClpP [Bacillus cereus]MEB9583007.1 Clp protease ClpP [Bacillus cereus]MEB9762308.1 Clp protease ClpP [Bacillus cereus]MEB9782482.1 Clp protease ClpP [Bacillus cereus]
PNKIVAKAPSISKKDNNEQLKIQNALDLLEL